MSRFSAGAALRGGQAAAPIHKQAASEFYAPLLPIVLELRERGLSLRAIARELQARGVKTRQEWDHWSATEVRRVLARARLAGQPPATGHPPSDQAGQRAILEIVIG